MNSTSANSLSTDGAAARAEAESMHSGTVVNLRDVGGHATADGRKVRTGSIYRSGQLAAAADPSINDLVGSGLQIVYDLRSTGERVAVPDQIPDHVQSVHLDVLADSDQSIAAHLDDLGNDMVAVNDMLRSGQVHEHYKATYRNLVTLQSARDSYRQMFTGLAEGDGVALFHCTAGKDRTGWAAATLLSILGVDDATIDADYLASSEPVVAAFQPLIDAFVLAGGEAGLLRQVFEVTPDYLDAARSEVDVVFGGFSNYLREGLGLDGDHLDAIRRRLLV